MNMNDPRTNPEAEGGAADLRLPDELVAELRREDSRWKLAVPGERDEQVMAACRAELAKRLAEMGNRGSSAGSARDRATGMSPFRVSPRPQPATASRIVPFPRIWVRWAAAAVVVLLCGLMITRHLRDDPQALEINLAQPTILDAFNFARALESPNPGGAHFVDLNGDGRTDQADVDWLAQRAVQLPAGGAL
jgi:hypothetical protein